MYNNIDTPLKYRIKAICKHIGKDKNSGHYIIYGLVNVILKRRRIKN